MSQNIFIDPFVTSAPSLQGGAVGNGTLTIDRLTHFTITQDYTAVCTATDPFTVFTIVASEDGPIGTAIVGTQFKDEDLKIFLTIQQGPNQFDIGDTFTFSVEQGTDLTQHNLDSYDELPQKNFGSGVIGQNAGDHNIRFQQAALLADRDIQDLNYQSKLSGTAGNGISIQYIQGSILNTASRVIQDLTYEAATPGIDGNDIQIEYIQFTAAVQAEETIQDILYRADNPGLSGNGITIEYIGGGTQGSESVNVVGQAITVTIEDGVSTVDDIRLAIGLNASAAALVDAISLGNNNPQTIQGPTSLQGGSEAVGDAGNEIVNAVGNLIQITLESGVSNAQNIYDAIYNDPAALALITPTISGNAVTSQIAPIGPLNLQGGADNVGEPGNEIVEVTGNLIQITFNSGLSTSDQIKTAVEGNVDAAALVDVSLIGVGANETTQLVALSASQITNGESFEVSTANNTRNIRFYYRKDGVDLPPGTADDFPIDILSSDSALIVSVKTAAIINAFLEFNVAAPATSTFTIINEDPGEADDVVNFDVGSGQGVVFSITKILDGFDIGEELQTAPVARTFLGGGLALGTYAFNTKELTDSGNFFEGNANILVGGLNNQGNEVTYGNTLKRGPVELDDDVLANDSGDRVANAQQTINDLIQNGKAYILIENAEKALWSKPASDLTLNDDLSIVFTENGVVNTVLSTNTPVNIPDGHHLWVTVDRFNSVNLIPTVSATVPSSPKGEDIFRLCSRRGTNLVWWDNSLHREGKKIRIGEGASQGAVQEKLGTGNGTITNFPISSGLLPISEQSIIVWSNVVQYVIEDWSYDLNNNEIQFVDPVPLGVEVYVFFLSEGDTITPPQLSGVEQVEYRTISPTEILNKELQLISTPGQSAKTKLDVIGGSSVFFNEGFSVAGNILSWSGYSLDGILEAGDKLRICYFS